MTIYCMYCDKVAVTAIKVRGAYTVVVCNQHKARRTLKGIRYGQYAK